MTEIKNIKMPCPFYEKRANRNPANNECIRVLILKVGMNSKQKVNKKDTHNYNIDSIMEPQAKQGVQSYDDF